MTFLSSSKIHTLDTKIIECAYHVQQLLYINRYILIDTFLFFTLIIIYFM